MTLSRLRRFESVGAVLATAGLAAAISNLAIAQEAPVAPPPPPPVIAPAEPPPTSPEPPPPSSWAPPAPVAEPTPAPFVPTSAEVAAEPVAPPPPAEEAETPWYSNLKLGAFVDAYAAIRSDRNARPNFAGVAYGGYYHEAYAQANGFALAFGGIDAAYSGEKLGATISLRFGPGLNRFYAADVSNLGIQNITQAFVTYKPVETLTLDLGQFTTIYGAEVLESWKNINYSRGALYYAMQPFWHTGLRANLVISDAIALNGLIVNGVNNAFENNKSPSLGLQAVITAGKTLTLAVGYLGAINPRDGVNGIFQNFFDAVATITAGGFKLVANADLNLYKNPGSDNGENFWGISVAPSYAFNDMLGIGVRFEYLADSANLWGMSKTKTPFVPETTDTPATGTPASKAALTTLTATIDIKPIPGVTALILRPEFRVEFANNYYFYNKDEALTKTFWTLMLGAVVTSM